MEKKSILKGLTRNILIVGLISLFTDLSSEMVFPLIPLYLVFLGGGGFVVALVEGAAETTASLLKVFSGYWSDKIKKRKPFVIAGYSLSTITKPLFAFANSWLIVLFVRVFERIGKGIRTAPRDAIIAESCDSCVRGKSYGFHRTMDSLGAIIGATIALILFPIYGFKNIFLYAFIPGIIAVICIIFIKEKQKITECKEEKALSMKISFKQLPRNLRIFIFIATVFTIGNFGYPFLMLRTKMGNSNDTAILFYLIFLIVSTILSIPTGILSDKIGRKPVILTGYFMFAFICVILIFYSTFYILLLCFILFGIFSAMIEGVQRAYVVDLAPSELKATALGTFHTSIGLIALPGGLIGGLIWDVISPEATFFYALVFTLSAIVMFMFLKNKKDIRVQ